MTRQLVFVHGRAQQRKDAVALKREWVDAWATGLRESGLAVPISDTEIRFPYYGDTLDDLVRSLPPEQIAAIIVRGEGAERDEQAFLLSVLDDVRQSAGIGDAALEDIVASDVLERGPANWEWVQAIVAAIDMHVPGASGAGIAIATRDVYQYLRNPGIRDVIETGVREALTRDAEAVVVGHSLGTVVSYNLLRREGTSQGWHVPLYVTVGSPLAVGAIARALRPNRHPECVGRWFNAMDHADIVALYPLDANHFDIDPSIENKTDVENRTPNRHGISGYLSDPEVAWRIHAALVA